MGWPYQFLSLSSEEKHLRRESLDYYATIAHCTALIPTIICLLIRLSTKYLGGSSGAHGDDGGGGGGVAGGGVGGRGRGAPDYHEVPQSPVIKATRLSSHGALRMRWRRFRWWMGDDVYFLGGHWGQRDQWVLGMGWMAWMLLLCVLGTGNDYLHLTKRFGIIAMSQMPIHYCMSLKLLNPFAWVFQSSHEQVNHYHRVLGRVIYALVLLHLLFYNYYFLRMGTWLDRFFAPVVFCGVVASLGMHAIFGTSLVRVRQASYRVFFVTHLVAALFIPVIIFFHAPSARFFAVECVLVFVADLVSRKTTTIKSSATIEGISGTNLLKVRASVPADKIADFEKRPASHIYLSVPPGSRPAKGAAVYDYLYNPFTISAVDRTNGEITFVARNRNGPLTNHLGDVATSTDEAKLRLDLEGPKGALGKNIHDLLSPGVDRILLIAGGIGATFTLPLYLRIRNDKHNAKVRFIWAVRGAADATWAIPTNQDGGSSRNVLDDKEVDIFVTGDMVVGASGDDNVEDTAAVEMQSLTRDHQNDTRLANNDGSHTFKRPDIERIVDDTFRHGSEETVAVIVCGPAEMGRRARSCVRPWVMKGRNVIWHNEAFGW